MSSRLAACVEGNSERLFARREPLPDESLLGCVMRISEANALASPSWLLGHLECSEQRLPSILDLAMHAPALRALERMAQLPANTLEPLSMREVGISPITECSHGGDLRPQS